MDKRCLSCLTHSAEKLMKRYCVSDKQHCHLSETLQNIISTAHKGSIMPELTANFHTEFKNCTGISDPYLHDKQYANATLLGMYNEFYTQIQNSNNPFDTALRMAVAGNIIDLGIEHEFDIHQTIKTVLNSDFGIDDSVLLYEKIKTAQTILYLGDNCGEVVFDKLFLETIKHPRVFYAVRGGAILNDVTEKEAYEVGIDKFATIISNGSSAPSTLLHMATDQFKTLFAEADLIISKGMGNYEGLSNTNDDRIFFLLMIKCHVVGEQIGLPKGNFVAMQYQSNKL